MNYGIWVMIMTIAGYVQIADLGAIPSLTKYVAESLAGNELEKARKYISTIFIFYFLIGLLIILLVHINMGLIMKLFFKNNDITFISSILTGFLMLVWINMLCEPLSSYLRGLQKIYLVNFVQAFMLVVNAGCTIFFLYRGFGISGLLMAQFIAVGCRFIITIILSWNFVKTYSVSRIFHFDKDSFKSIFILTSADQVNRITGIITGTWNKFFLQRFSGIGFLTYYDLAHRVDSQLSIIPSTFFTPLIPAISSLNKRNDYESSGKLIHRSLKYLIYMGTPILLFFMMFSENLITAWIGDYPQIAFGVKIVMIATYTNLLSGPIFHALIGMGKVRAAVIKLLIAFFINLPLVFFLGHYWGFWGIIWGEAISIMISNIYFFKKGEQDVGIKYVHLILKTFFQVALVNLLSILLVIITLYSTLHILPWTNLIPWIAAFVLYYVFTFYLYKKLGFIGEYEIKLLETAILKRNPLYTPHISNDINP